MFNPVLRAKSGPYQTEEACLSLVGSRSTTRYQEITVDYLDRNWQPQTITLKRLFRLKSVSTSWIIWKDSYMGDGMNDISAMAQLFYFIGFLLLLGIFFYYGFCLFR